MTDAGAGGLPQARVTQVMADLGAVYARFARVTGVMVDVALGPVAPPPPPPPGLPSMLGGGGRPDYRAACGFPPTAADYCIARRWAVMGAVNRGAVCEQDPLPWREPPAGAERFQQVGVLPLPALEGVDFLVLSWQMPTAYDGVITTMSNLFTGAGFVNGSGDLIWRVMLDNQWVTDLQAIDITVGRPSMPLQLKGAGYRTQTHQTFRYFVRLGAGALGRLDPAGNVICGMFGWLYPRGGKQ